MSIAAAVSTQPEPQMSKREAVMLVVACSERTAELLRRRAELGDWQGALDTIEAACAESMQGVSLALARLRAP
jgi:hypothetical protein